MRQDILRYADKLSGACGIDSASLYAWLMYLGKDRGVNPRTIPLAVGLGRVQVVGSEDTDYIERYTPPAPWTPEDDGPDYEELILERQDSWYDD